MSIRAKAGLIGALAVVLVAAAPTGEEFTLKRIVKVGDVHTYRLTMDMTTQGVEFNVSLDIEDKVTNVAADGGYTVRQTTSNQIVTIDGTEMPPQEGGTGTVTHDAVGFVTGLESSQQDRDGYRRASMLNMLWPNEAVSVGSKWSYDTKADPKKGTYDMTHSFELVSVKKLLGQNILKIKVASKETSVGKASGTGYVWIEARTGIITQAVGQVKNAPMAGGTMDAKYSLVLIK